MQTTAHNMGREERRALLSSGAQQWHANCVAWRLN